ncbi:MAG: ATP-dependent DNA helicase RecG [Cytophagales bacterium]|nr:MAG: ATP-dependent DNA helicase RecG [Cytophagales bacterium]
MSIAQFLESKIEYMKGVGPHRAALLNELNIFTYRDLLQHYPFRHEDRSQMHLAKDLLEEMPAAQLKGKIIYLSSAGEGAKKRLIAYFNDGTGDVELLWFQGIETVKKNIKTHQAIYLVYGKPQFFAGKFSIVHPELEEWTPEKDKEMGWQPVYSITEKMRKKFFTSKALSKITQALIALLRQQPTWETLPDYLCQQYQLMPRKDAIEQIHFPKNIALLEKAKRRLKFEELFFVQLKLLKTKQFRKISYQGQILKDTQLLTQFYNEHLPFELTNAQKRVVKEIYNNLQTGKQMNRLVQGDVGSGKTMVAFLAMLIAIGNGGQACLMAPTEILADQHYNGLKKYADALGITIDKLTGTTKTKDRRVLLGRLENGNLKILVGTHALIEESVLFENLALCVIDEQHRFGVEQRSKLWKKNEHALYPHILVMTATPIPRTLAMTLYGDLDVSIIDELPKGRKPIITAHRYENNRLKVYEFIRSELNKGRQAYIVYPLIEESEKLDLKNLSDGYEQVKKAFPEFKVSMVHGKMNTLEKDEEMQRFSQQQTQIMVATTVIEVGVDVPNASVMVIENAERFGLAQLHQLRGRVGRGAEQSYCILMTDLKISKDSRTRLDTMVRTTNGFEISEVDMQLRGPGNLMGKEQSGLMNFLIADLAKDGAILEEARNAAQTLLETDAHLQKPENALIKQYLLAQKEGNYWSRIS